MTVDFRERTLGSYRLAYIYGSRHTFRMLAKELAALEDVLLTVVAEAGEAVALLSLDPDL